MNLHDISAPPERRAETSSSMVSLNSEDLYLWKIIPVKRAEKQAKHLPCKHEDLSSNPQKPCKTQQQQKHGCLQTRVCTGRWEVETEAAQKCQSLLDTVEKQTPNEVEGKDPHRRLPQFHIHKHTLTHPIYIHIYIYTESF